MNAPQSGPTGMPQNLPANASTGNGDQSIDEVPMFRRKRVIIPFLLLLAGLVAGGWYWYVQRTTYVMTDDAFIDADRATISSRILGKITRLFVDENDTVKAGDTLVKFDDADLLAQLAKAEASVRFLTQNATITSVALDKARDDFNRAQKEISGGVITQEQYTHAANALKLSQAQREMALSQIATAQADGMVVKTQLLNTAILAPIFGVIAKRWALSGDVEQPGQAIFSLYDVSHVWVTANYEETKLHSFQVGSRAKITLDAMPGAVLSGRVIAIGTATAAQFSLIPPNNASGNFTKITQRIPVKIAIEATPSGAVLRPGLSATVRIFSR